MIRIALRFDDPSATSDAALERSILRLLAHAGIPATVAVIPFRWVDGRCIALDATMAEHLIRAREAGTIEVALHGHCHELLPGEGKSEFRGLPDSVQHDKLTDGLRQLQSVFGDVITGFVPPFNSYDGATARCVTKLGLTYLSAGWSASLAEKLVFLPRTCQAVEIKSAIAEARRFASLAPIVIAVLHHYDFRESGSPESRMDLPEFEASLAWLGEQRDVQFVTLDALAAELSSAKTRAALRRRLHLPRLPWRLQSRLPRQCMTTAGWPRMLLRTLLP